MELAYILIEKYNEILEDIEMDFGGKYKFKYDKHRKSLDISKNTNYINNFFNLEGNTSIKNITGIIGKNGAGKSTVIDCVKGYFIDSGIICKEINKKYEFYNTILALCENNKLYVFISDELISSKDDIYCDDNIDINIVLYGNNHLDKAQNYNIIKNNLNSNLKIVDGTERLSEISCIYMSNIFDLSVPNFNTDVNLNYFDISTNGILDELERGLINVYGERIDKEVFFNEQLEEISNKYKISSTRRYKTFRKLQQLEFLSDNIDNYNHIQSEKFKLPTEILITTDCSYKRNYNTSLFANDKLLRYENKDITNKIENDIYVRLNNQIEGCNELDKKDMFIVYKSLMIRVIDSYFKDINRIIPNTKEYNIKLEENISKKYTSSFINEEVIKLLDIINETILETINDMVEIDGNYKKFKVNKNKINKIKSKHNLYKNYIKTIESLLFEESKITKYIKTNIFNEIIDIKRGNSISGVQEERGNIIIQLNSETLDTINKIIKINIQLEPTEDFIIFQFRDISSGEYSLLDTYSKIYSLKNHVKTKNILLLIDEGELYLHPEWQREYIYLLIEFLPKIFEDKNIQIIFASNSPFLISDLPRTNVIVLEKGNNIEISQNNIVKQTFGANIGKLLDDTFFMDYNIGEFCKTKIEKVIHMLRDEDGKYHNDKNNIKKTIELIEEPIIKKKLKELYNIKYGDIEEQVESLEIRINKLIEEKKELEEKLKKGKNYDKN